MKNTFVFYRSWLDAYEKLDCDERGRFIMNFKHFIDGRLDLISTPTLHEELLWSQVIPLLKKNGDEWDRRAETSKENGKKGGRPKRDQNEGE